MDRIIGSHRATSRYRQMFAAPSLLALVAAGAGHAQTTTPDPASKAKAVEEIVVTGTQIRGVAPIGAPVIAVGQQEIIQSGLNTTADILHDIPQITSLGAGQNYNGGNQNANLDTNRDNAINIRGLGPQATLTLLDGRRTPLGGASGNLYDPSSIPTIALANIDVLTDGASATYGSDAVAGVANLVLRKNFDGLEAEASYGSAAGYNTHKLAAIFGNKWDGGSIMLAAETNYSSVLTASQRSNINQCNVAGVNSCSFYNPTYGNVAYNGNTTYYGVPVTNSGTGITNSQLAAANYFNPAGDVDMLPKTNRNSVVWNIQQDATSQIRLWTEGYFTQNDISFPQGQLTPSGSVTAANPGFIPLGVGQTSEKGYAGLDGYIGPAERRGFERAYQAAGGADIALPAGWALNAYYEHNFNYEYTNTTSLNAAAVTTAFSCATPGLCFDPFGPNPGNGAAISSFVGNVYYNYHQIEDLFNAKLDGSIYTLPGGDVKLAVGMEIHHDTLTVLSDNTTAGSTVNILHIAADFTKDRTVGSAFGEVIIPVIGPDNQLPFVQSFIIDGAGRYDQYSDVGGTLNPKVSFSWRPVADVTIHGDYGTSFRAPTLCDETGGCSAGFNSEPATAYGGANVIETFGGNPGLKPETAVTWSFGGDYKPKWLDGFSASLDYFNIDYTNVIGTPGQLVTNAALLTNPLFSKLVVSGAALAPYLANLQTQTFYIPPTLFPVTSINDVIIGTRQNSGVILTQGIDFGTDYKWKNSLGAWSAGVNGTYLIDYNESILPGLPLVHELNKWQYPVSWRARAKFSWGIQDLTAVAYVNYTGAYENTADINKTPNATVGAYTTVDATLVYKISRPDLLDGFAKNTTISISVLNLLDAAPPYALTTTTTQYDGEQANPLGRQVTVTLRKSF